MIANWTKQVVASAPGTAVNISLGIAVDGHIEIQQNYADGATVQYSVVDGFNRETGIGTYTSVGNILSRDTVLETLDAGVYDKTTPAKLNLTADAVVAITNTNYAANQHRPVWKNLTTAFSAGLGLAAYAVPGSIPLAGGVLAPDFHKDNMEEVGIYFQMPHDIMVGSDMYLEIHWAPTDATTGTVRWGIEYTTATDNGVFSATNTIYFEEAGGGVANTNQHVECLPADTITAMAPDSLILGRMFRDAAHANDTYDNVALGISCNLHYQAEYLGTPGRQANIYDWV